MPKLNPVLLNGTVAGRASIGNSNAKRDAFEDVYSTHVMTQVDLLKKKGFTGKGIRVGVVDTGIDYRHPALGGCFGEGCLVSFSAFYHYFHEKIFAPHPFFGFTSALNKSVS